MMVRNIMLEVPRKRADNICMMNEIDKGLRGLGGTKMVTEVSYADVVVAVKACIDDVTDDNECEFDMNVDLFLEGLKEDIYELHAGRECGIVPKTTEDADSN
jgi:hypothetical protein